MQYNRNATIADKNGQMKMGKDCLVTGENGYV